MIVCVSIIPVHGIPGSFMIGYDWVPAPNPGGLCSPERWHGASSYITRDARDEWRRRARWVKHGRVWPTDLNLNVSCLLGQITHMNFNVFFFGRIIGFRLSVELYSSRGCTDLRLFNPVTNCNGTHDVGHRTSCPTKTPQATSLGPRTDSDFTTYWTFPWLLYIIIRRYRAIPSYGVRNSACRDVPASSTALKHSGSMPKITSDLPKELSTRQKEKHWYIITVKWWMLLEIHRNASSQILLKQKWNMHKPILPILFLPSPKRCLLFCFRPLASRNFWLHGRPQCFTEKTQPLGMAWKTSMGMVNQTIYDDFSSAEKMIFRKEGT